MRWQIVFLLVFTSLCSAESPPKTVFRLKGEKIELRSIPNPATTSKAVPILGANEVEYIVASEAPSKNGFEVTFYPNEKAVSELHTRTKPLVGETAGMYRDGKLLMSARMNEPMVSSLQVNMQDKEAYKSLIKGLTLDDPKLAPQLEKKYSAKREEKVRASGSPEDRLMLASSLQAKGDHQGAINLLNKIRAEDNTKKIGLSPCLLYGESFRKLNRPKEAEKIYGECLQDATETWPVRKDLAEMLAATKKYPEAYSELSKYVEDIETAARIAVYEQQLHRLQSNPSKTDDVEKGIALMKEQLGKEKAKLGKYPKPANLSSGAGTKP